MLQGCVPRVVYPHAAMCASCKHIARRADPLFDALRKVHVLHRRHTKSDDALADGEVIAANSEAVGRWRQLIVQDNGKQAQMRGVPLFRPLPLLCTVTV